MGGARTVGRGPHPRSRGTREGPVRRAWVSAEPVAAGVAAERLAGILERDRLYVEVQRHRLAGEERWNAFLVDWASGRGACRSYATFRTASATRSRSPSASSTCSRACATTRRSTRPAKRLAPQPGAPPEGRGRDGGGSSGTCRRPVSEHRPSRREARVHARANAWATGSPSTRCRPGSRGTHVPSQDDVLRGAGSAAGAWWGPCAASWTASWP